MIESPYFLSTKIFKMVNSTLIERDLKHIWHPCSQMKDFETVPPFVINEARGSILYTNKGPLIDANSSWWCKSLGHQHPAVIEAIKKQLSSFEHVIAANTTHPLLVELAECLAEMSKLQYVFFASDGSTAVEIAMKLALHANIIKGRPHKREFIALRNAYHGETLATLAVSDLGIYKEPYRGFGPHCHFIESLPYVANKEDPLWSDGKADWHRYEPFLNNVSENVCAVLVEPIVQGAGGMKIYSADFLKRLSQWAKSKDILVIADEIMTGCARTGTWLASEHAGVVPDMICLSKGLTSGSIPFSCVMLDHGIYELFYDDYEKGKSFLHSHTYSGNPLGASAALATLKAMKEENILEQVQQLENYMAKSFAEIAKASGKLVNIRHIGGIIAADLYPCEHSRTGYQIYVNALERGAFLRPLGNTLYWLPPLNTDADTISKLAEITLNSINAVYFDNT